MRAFHLETIHFGVIHFVEIHKIAGPLWGSTYDFGLWVFNFRLEKYFSFPKMLQLRVRQLFGSRGEPRHLLDCQHVKTLVDPVSK